MTTGICLSSVSFISLQQVTHPCWACIVHDDQLRQFLACYLQRLETVVGGKYRIRDEARNRFCSSSSSFTSSTRRILSITKTSIAAHIFPNLENRLQFNNSQTGSTNCIMNGNSLLTASAFCPIVSSGCIFTVDGGGASVNFLELAKESIIIGDGAIGTMLYSKGLVLTPISST